jgi:hypothetical protein
MYWLLIIFLALLIYFIFFVSQFYNIFFRGYAPFISTDSETIKKILNEVKISDRAVIYELGCGRARFLKIAKKTFSDAKCIGVENLFSLYLINRIRLKLQFSNIKLLKQNFFALNLKEADLIYCYLNNSTMEKLGEKFRQECKPGTQVVSRSLQIPQLIPEKVMTIKNKKIYFYIIKID